MGRRSRTERQFSRPDGVLGVPRVLVRSPAFRSISPRAVMLLLVLQDVWRPPLGSVHMGERDAAKRLGCSQRAAGRAFDDLRDAGFIVCVNESDFLSGKAREWRLTWLPCGNRAPTDEWASPLPPADSGTPLVINGESRAPRFLRGVIPGGPALSADSAGVSAKSGEIVEIPGARTKCPKRGAGASLFAQSGARAPRHIDE
jgi:hypothetical protein